MNISTFFCEAIFCIWTLKCEIVDLVMLNDINSLLCLAKYGSNNGGRYQSWPKIEFPINHFYLIDFIDDISTDFTILPKRQYSRWTEREKKKWWNFINLKILKTLKKSTMCRFSIYDKYWTLNWINPFDFTHTHTPASSQFYTQSYK